MGNPLLDVSATVDEAFLKKYEVSESVSVPVCASADQKLHHQLARTAHQLMPPPSHALDTFAAGQVQPDPGRGQAPAHVPGGTWHVHMKTRAAGMRTFTRALLAAAMALMLPCNHLHAYTHASVPLRGRSRACILAM